MIPLMIANALADKPLPVYGEGLNVRDWLYVEDHCTAIDLILCKGKPGQVYNIGGHNERRNIDIVKTILAILGKRKASSRTLRIAKATTRDMPSTRRLFIRELGWLPQTKFEDGIRKTVQWYLDNKPWWENIVNGEYRKYL